MAKQRWREWCENENNLAVLEAWARAGLTDEKVANKIGISRSTLNEWKKKYPRFQTALSVGKEMADRLVENSLYQMTQGRTVQVRKAFKVRESHYDEHGRKVESEELKTIEEDVYIEPDFKAIAFWLKNRRPEDWKERVEQINTDEGNKTGLIVLTPQKVQELQEVIEDGNKST